ncbi:MAG: cytidylate kinase-like family protein [Alistipes sp.]|nr:cytidylate kinase-like family protein [Alistipes sp.]MBR3847456.1 cytidylate kinase-like family protein [Alistipes sp.]
MQTHYAINIGRQYGSGGIAVGKILSEQLAIKLYDKELINLAAEESGFSPEHFERADEHEQKGMLAAVIGYFRSPLAGDYALHNPLSNDSLFKIQSDVIRQLAEREDCIFVGRCADYILRERPRTVNIFLTADMPDRIRRVADRSSLSDEKAAELIERIDHERARYYNYYSSRKWGEAASYDLCINTSLLGVEQTAELILDFTNKKLKINR